MQKSIGKYYIRTDGLVYKFEAFRNFEETDLLSDEITAKHGKATPEQRELFYGNYNKPTGREYKNVKSTSIKEGRYIHRYGKAYEEPGIFLLTYDLYELPDIVKRFDMDGISSLYEQSNHIFHYHHFFQKILSCFDFDFSNSGLKEDQFYDFVQDKKLINFDKFDPQGISSLYEQLNNTLLYHCYFKNFLSCFDFEVSNAALEEDQFYEFIQDEELIDFDKFDPLVQDKLASELEKVHSNDTTRTFKPSTN